MNSIKSFSTGCCSVCGCHFLSGNSHKGLRLYLISEESWMLIEACLFLNIFSVDSICVYFIVLHHPKLLISFLFLQNSRLLQQVCQVNVSYSIWSSILVQLVQWLNLLRVDSSVSKEQCTRLSNQLLEVLQRSTAALESLLVSHGLVLRLTYCASHAHTASN